MVRKSNACAQKKISTVMHEWKSGKLRLRNRQKVTNYKQAVAIALSEARKSCGKRSVPFKRKSKRSVHKRSTTKRPLRKR